MFWTLIQTGFNNFREACLKLTFGGKTMYYSGGAGDYPTKEEAVIEVFSALSLVQCRNHCRRSSKKTNREDRENI